MVEPFLLIGQDSTQTLSICGSKDCVLFLKLTNEAGQSLAQYSQYTDSHKVRSSASIGSHKLARDLQLIYQGLDFSNILWNYYLPKS